jgi:LuxR family quorum sensing-dependent transcriptional regulator
MEACLIALLAPSTETIPPPQVLVDLWPKEWSVHYFKNRLIKHDPCASLCLTANQLFSWRSVAHQRLQPAEADVMKSAEAHGLRDGFCLPIHGSYGKIGVVSVAGSRIERQPSLRFLIESAGYCGYQKIERLRSDTGHPILTKRQAEVCDWIAAGKTAAQVAAILGISETTVERHLRDSRERLGTTNRVHTIVTAIKRRELRI